MKYFLKPTSVALFCAAITSNAFAAMPTLSSLKSGNLSVSESADTESKEGRIVSFAGLSWFAETGGKSYSQASGNLECIFILNDKSAAYSKLQSIPQEPSTIKYIAGDELEGEGKDIFTFVSSNHVSKPGKCKKILGLVSGEEAGKAYFANEETSGEETSEGADEEE